MTILTTGIRPTSRIETKSLGQEEILCTGSRRKFRDQGLLNLPSGGVIGKKLIEVVIFRNHNFWRNGGGVTFQAASTFSNDKLWS